MREDLLPSCGLWSPQTASSCQPLQGGPQLLRAQGHALLGGLYLVAELGWGPGHFGIRQDMVVGTPHSRVFSSRLVETVRLTFQLDSPLCPVLLPPPPPRFLSEGLIPPRHLRHLNTISASACREPSLPQRVTYNFGSWIPSQGPAGLQTPFYYSLCRFCPVSFKLFQKFLHRLYFISAYFKTLSQMYRFLH